MAEGPAAEGPAADEPAGRSAILVARNLERRFDGHGRDGGIVAVDGVSFEIGACETLGLIGESGCGKTTTAKLLLGLDKPTGGSVLHHGRDVASLDREGRRTYRRSVQAVFQDPQSSLNPRMRVGAIVREPLVAAGGTPRAEVRARVAETLERVGLEADAAHRFPHQFSGGQRQRIAIARALAMRPELAVLDEPVASLDVSVRSQILALLKDLQSQFRMSYLLISHDLATAGHLCDRIAVMYLGRIVETGSADEVYDSPRHPFTRELLEAARFAFADEVDTKRGTADETAVSRPVTGCRFRTRCPMAEEICARVDPQLHAVSPTQQVACHLA